MLLYRVYVGFFFLCDVIVYLMNHDNICVTLLDDEFEFFVLVVYSDKIQCIPFVHFAIHGILGIAIFKLLFIPFYYRGSLLEHRQ